jgi:thioredoxin reductase
MESVVDVAVQYGEPIAAQDALELCQIAQSVSICVRRSVGATRCVMQHHQHRAMSYALVINQRRQRIELLPTDTSIR